MSTKAKSTDAPLEGFIRLGQLARLYSVSRTTIHTWRRKGILPPPVRLGPNTIAWPAEVIRDWQAARPRV
jgi:predicted DNA-binding transcriptional regulator AlpA